MNLTREILKTPITMDDFKKAYRITIDVWTVDKNGELDEVVESYHCMGDDSFSVNHMEETEFFRKDFDKKVKGWYEKNGLNTLQQRLDRINWYILNPRDNTVIPNRKKHDVIYKVEYFTKSSMKANKTTAPKKPSKKSAIKFLENSVRNMF